MISSLRPNTVTDSRVTLWSSSLSQFAQTVRVPQPKLPSTGTPLSEKLFHQKLQNCPKHSFTKNYSFQKIWKCMSKMKKDGLPWVLPLTIQVESFDGLMGWWVTHWEFWLLELTAPCVVAHHCCQTQGISKLSKEDFEGWGCLLGTWSSSQVQAFKFDFKGLRTQAGTWLEFGVWTQACKK